PTAAALVEYLNYNARLVQSLKSTKVELDAKQNGESIGLEGTLFCQKPRNFRLRATDPLGKPAVDVGSNDNEFWFWISEARDEDAGNGICRATVQDVQVVPVNEKAQAVLPQRVTLVWKDQKIELKMRLYETQANSIDAQRAAKLFSRGDLASIPASNLAQGPD